MFDIIIIGAGTAGIAAYKEAIKFTQNILIINDGAWDTTCARVGCMPSKVLISSANRAFDIEHSNLVGLKSTSKIDTSNVLEHVRELRDRFTRATLKDVNSWDKAHKVSGKAHFIDAHSIQVNNQTYQAKSFIIAVGSRPTINQEWQDELGELYLSSDQIFEIPNLPKSIAVVGSGVIAIELAQAMQRLGVETTIFARSQKVGSLSSPNLQQLAQETLASELSIKYKVLPDQIKKYRNKAKIIYTENGIPQTLITDYILSATGRTTNLDTLTLENVESRFKDIKNLPINETTKQLANLPIYVVGDAFSNTPIQHVAAHEGRLAVLRCLNDPKSMPEKVLTPLGIMFSSPEMAGVGQNYQSLKEQNIDFITGFANYEKQGRAIVNGENIGAVEVYVDIQSRKLLGAELFIYDAEHLAHLLAWMIAQHSTIDEILENPFYHPTIEEGLRTALKHARRQLPRLQQSEHQPKRA